MGAVLNMGLKSKCLRQAGSGEYGSFDMLKYGVYNYDQCY